MPRPIKWRRVCCLPENSRFGPLDIPKASECAVIMTVDEYETIRLIDHESYTQEECAVQMNVARSTVQGVYNEARKKLADLLVNGKELYISGGEYRLCDKAGMGCRGCCRQNRQSKPNGTVNDNQVTTRILNHQ